MVALYSLQQSLVFNPLVTLMAANMVKLYKLLLLTSGSGTHVMPKESAVTSVTRKVGLFTDQPL